jgi:hypothetical protein
MIRTLWQIFKILRWHKKTFPQIDYERQTEKIGEEILEWDREFFIGDDVEKELEELTDVIIASISAFRFKEVQLLVQDKMQKNYTRKWDKNGHHVEEKHGKYRA